MEFGDVRGFNLGDPGDEVLGASPFAQQSGEALNQLDGGGQGRTTRTDRLQVFAVLPLQTVRSAQDPLAYLPDRELSLSWPSAGSDLPRGG